MRTDKQYTPLTLQQILILKRALAIAYQETKKRDDPDNLAANAMEAGDYFSLYKLISECPDLAMRSTRT